MGAHACHPNIVGTETEELSGQSYEPKCEAPGSMRDPVFKASSDLTYTTQERKKDVRRKIMLKERRPPF